MGNSSGANLDADSAATMSKSDLTDPGVQIPGIGANGQHCSCQVPAVDIGVLHEADKEYIKHLDGYTMRSLMARKPEAEALFAAGFGRVAAARDRFDKALARLVEEYGELAVTRHDLEIAQQSAAYTHVTRCKPLKEKYGLYLPCHEHFRSAMRTYRGMQKPPTCVVGASLPLRPAGLPEASLAFPPPVPVQTAYNHSKARAGYLVGSFL
mmetsp:Transcript_25094/g.49139  ORF Transcript_25094/g.49139 Transcript_25094/m.49139 type:complete len:210 (-) Transcript_25094:112-741(-)